MYNPYGQNLLHQVVKDMTITHDNLKYNFPTFGQGLSQNPAPKSGRPRDKWCVVSECVFAWRMSNKRESQCRSYVTYTYDVESTTSRTVNATTDLTAAPPNLRHHRPGIRGYLCTFLEHNCLAFNQIMLETNKRIGKRPFWIKNVLIFSR